MPPGGLLLAHCCGGVIAAAKGQGVRRGTALRIAGAGPSGRERLIGTVDAGAGRRSDSGVADWLGEQASKYQRLVHLGPLNKLAVYVGSGIPVDLFATTEECWFNALVCRTGSAETNVKIAVGRVGAACYGIPTDAGSPTRMAPG